MMLNLICQMVILFFTFAVIGWCMEVVLKFIQYRRFINRGFLIGPYCPIYGFGTVAVTLLVGGMFSREGTVSEIFWAGVVMCGVLEYFTGWYMEKRFHARWWDYSNKPMNLHGRIWIGNLLLFGAGSVIIVCLVDPVFFSLVNKLSTFWLRLIAAVIVALMAADYTASHFLMEIVKKEIDAQDGDNTEEISARVHLLLRDKNLLIRRIEQAYPDLNTRPRWLTEQLRQAKKEYKASKHSVAEVIRSNRQEKSAEKDELWNAQLEAALEKRKAAARRLRETREKMQHRSDEEIE